MTFLFPQSKADHKTVRYLSGLLLARGFGDDAIIAMESREVWEAGGGGAVVPVFVQKGANPSDLLAVAPFNNPDFIARIRSHIGWDSNVGLLGHGENVPHDFWMCLDAVIYLIDDRTCWVRKNRVGPVGLLHLEEAEVAA